MIIENITREAFAPFGWVLEFPANPDDPRFEIIVREESAGWRLAVFRVTQRECGRLECHPGSPESFEPVSGAGVLLAAEHGAPDRVRAFLLDAPVCLRKGVWHDMITLSRETIVKITENLEVESVFHELAKPVTAELCERSTEYHGN